jgi:peptide chain release factor 1
VIQKVALLKQEFDELERRLATLDIQKNTQTFKQLTKDRAALEPVVREFELYQKLKEEKDQALHTLTSEHDEGLKQLFKDEVSELEVRIEGVMARMKQLLIPKDPNDDKNIMVEIRAGAGGDEAGLFVGDLLRMYEHYANLKKWSLEVLSASGQGVGGFREVIAMIRGQGVYSRLKFEAGVHRVQRVPETEAQGRIHTSTVTVAVLPEADEVEVEIHPNDLRIDVFRSSGPGGQSVNTTDSAVRITHIPSGIVVSMQDEKSQHKNKAKALKILRNKLFAMAQAEQQASIASSRKLQVGTGERSERIRTYNFPQSRVTDHRIGLTLYSLDSVLHGGLDSLIDPLIADYQASQMVE